MSVIVVLSVMVVLLAALVSLRACEVQVYTCMREFVCTLCVREGLHINARVRVCVYAFVCHIFVLYINF